MKGNQSALGYLSRVSGRKKGYIGMLLLVQMLLGGSGVYSALLMRKVIDSAVASDRQGFMAGLSYFCGLILLQIALRALIRFGEEYAKATYENQLKKRVFRSLLQGDFEQVSKVHSGEWMNRLTSDTVVVAEGMATIVPGLAGMLVRMLAALCVILWFVPQFLYLLVPGGILLVALTYGFRRILKGLHKNMQEADGRVRSFLQERLGSLIVIKAFSAEESMVSEAEDKMTEHKKARMKKNHFSNFCNVGFGAVMNGAYALALGYCGYGLLTRTITYGTLMAVLQLVGQIQGPFANISGYLPKYYGMIASAERLMEAEAVCNLEVSPVMTEAETASNVGFGAVITEAETASMLAAKAVVTEETSANNIVFSKVTFGYDEEHPVLSDYSMEIKPGELVALVGPSGCGKSTVLKLLLGLYHPQSGEILPKGKQENTYAYVPQGNHLMSGTIREVVTFADREGAHDEARIRRALTLACADFVYDLEDGVETELGERGAGLSEGQMQRLSIARALFADYPVLLLDEATSALDAETEKQLLVNLKTLTDKTVLIVTHREAVAEVCDKVLTPMGGRR